MFQFKQFSVDQTGCAMKINTDGVLLGAMSEANEPRSILDIGTGTGVIALMLAQRFADAQIDAVEIDLSAANTAACNFINSPFSDRLSIHPSSIKAFFEDHLDAKFDLIVSNPPFYLNSLESPEGKKTLAKHTDAVFFEELIKDVATHLSDEGCCWLIYPSQQATMIKSLIEINGMYLQKTIHICSFEKSEAHRQIACFGLQSVGEESGKFVIYDNVGVYSDEYKKLLQPYFLAF